MGFVPQFPWESSLLVRSNPGLRVIFYPFFLEAFDMSLGAKLSLAAEVTVLVQIWLEFFVVSLLVVLGLLIHC